MSGNSGMDNGYHTQADGRRAATISRTVNMLPLEDRVSGHLGHWEPRRPAGAKRLFAPARGRCSPNRYDRILPRQYTSENHALQYLILVGQTHAAKEIKMKSAWKVVFVGVVFIALSLAASAQQAETKKEPPKAEAKEPAKTDTQTETLKVDPVHSTNWFRIRHLNITNFYGRFDELSGTIILDAAKPANSSFEITVNVQSIDTNNADRDKHLKSAELFDAEKYPAITFKSQSVKKTTEKEYEVKGDLTLRGVTKPLTVKITRTGTGPGMRGEIRSGFETSFEIKRSDFGMTAAIGAIGDEVLLTVSLETVRQS
jgi:polyisoprenoid-binding protein YceI